MNKGPSVPVRDRKYLSMASPGQRGEKLKAMRSTSERLTLVFGHSRLVMIGKHRSPSYTLVHCDVNVVHSRETIVTLPLLCSPLVTIVH